MSCLRYRKIKNPIHPDRRGWYDKIYISIPDCRCSKCRKAKSNDWLVRSYFEYTSKPTDAFFITLDFDDKHLPIYNDIPCFDSKLMHDFFEILRQSKLMPPFRYLYSSDYGGALERPHYHVAMLFDKGAISLDCLAMIITMYWKFGSHEDIQQINPRYKGNPFKCFEYVCKYTTKELSFDLRTRELSLPARYRSRTYASLGYGAQCLDPNEIDVSKLLKAGVVFNDRPTITRDYLLNNSVLYLDIKNNGILVPFSIPRYYELKLMYDYSKDLNKKVILRRNEYGFKLQEIRHNCHYMQVYRDFVNSRDLSISWHPDVARIFATVFPDSPYNGSAWCDIVDDVLLDPDFFWHTCMLYDYLEFTKFKDDFHIAVPKVYELDGRKFLFHSLACHGSYRRSIDYFKYDLQIQALFMFNTYNILQKLREAHYDDWEQRENNKARLLAELKRNPQKKRYLRYKGFKFSKLNFSKYVSFNFFKEDQVCEQSSS